MDNEPRVPLPEGVEKVPTHLYGISGWYSQEGVVACAAFGGYFRYGVLDNLVVDGQLVDSFGSSAITGELKDDRLSFLKIYDHRRDTIQYTFNKENGIWIGSYDGPAVGTGKAKCQTFLIEDDAFQILCGKPRRY